MTVLPLVDVALHAAVSLQLPILSPAGLVVALVVRRRRRTGARRTSGTTPRPTTPRPTTPRPTPSSAAAPLP